MSEYTSYILFWMVLFIILGSFWYILDRLHGVRWYRRWYALTHRDPLPQDVVVGFIYNRRSRHKVVMATVLSTVQTFIALTSVESLNLLVELILWIVEIPMVMIGFAIGPMAFKLWKRKDEMLDAVDDFEQSHFSGDSGESPSKATRATKAATSVKTATSATSAKTAETGSTAAAETPASDDKTESDPKKLFDRYTKR